MGYIEVVRKAENSPDIKKYKGGNVIAWVVSLLIINFSVE